jgi:hypothetical protein
MNYTYAFLDPHFPYEIAVFREIIGIMVITSPSSSSNSWTNWTFAALGCERTPFATVRAWGLEPAVRDIYIVSNF